MTLAFLPSRRLIAALLTGAALALAALLLQVPVITVSLVVAVAAGVLLLVAATDGWLTARRWAHEPLQLERHLPAALALGVRTPLRATARNPSARPWRVQWFDHAGGSLALAGLPQDIDVAPGKAREVQYLVTPTQRGEVQFAAIELRVHSALGLIDLIRRVGATEHVRVFPNFAAVARYAWLAGDRRLTEIGIKTYTQRGAGTDFRELAEYRAGDPIRHIDWKATLKHNKPIVREFQDERDQCVMFLLDCGRRMRAHEQADAAVDALAAEGQPVALSHFDHALNAVMLMAYVALKQGDEVGALTFGAAPGTQRLFAPRKGVTSFNALMGALYEIEPQATHSDYMEAARDFMQRHSKRALVVVITNFRDEDAAELGPALRLLRTRHLVMLASLRERVVRELAEQPLGQFADGRVATEIAAAHLYEQSRRDAFNRLSASTGSTASHLMVDVEPERLPVELVNRYHAVKRAGLL